MEKRQSYTQRTDSGEAADVVKGVAKRVIVVRSPDPKVFEEAIFIVREDYMNSAGISRTQLLNQAKQAAGRYIGSVKGQRARKPAATGLVAALSALLGSGAAAAVMYFIM